MDQLQSKIIEKISSLTTSQQERLLRTLSEKTFGSDKDDLLDLATLLVELRNTSCFKNRFNKIIMYKKHLKDKEKELELELYNKFQKLGIQLRKGGYDSDSFETRAEFGLTDEEKETIDRVFPELKTNQKNTMVIPHPDLTEQQLMFKDAEASARYIAMRVVDPEYEKRQQEIIKENKLRT